MTQIIEEGHAEAHSPRWSDLRRHIRRRAIRDALVSENGLLLSIATISFFAHLLVASNYGYFRDELYYIAAGRRLAWGYVDFPPLIAVVAAILRPFTQDNLLALHVVTALASAILIVVTGLIARELGGGRFAQGLAATGATVALVYMATGSLFTYDVFDELWWGLGAYVLVRLLKRHTPRLWLLFGLIMGVGLFTKLTILFFGFAVVVGLLATPARSYFRSWEIYAGGVIAFAFLAPYAAWNAVNGWPTLEFWTHYGGFTGSGPLDFIANQIFTMNPLTMPLWLAGLYFYLRSPAGRSWRALGWAYVALLVVFLALHVKPYFFSPVYPPLLAAGAVVLAQARRRPRRLLWRQAYAGLLIASGLLLVPLAMPVLPPATFAKTYGALSTLGNASAGQQTQGVFPQYLGDRFGWIDLAMRVSRVYHGLPEREQAEACILTENYGEAAALELYRDQYHLPPVISGHNTYYLWGPGACSGKVLITVNIAAPKLQRVYGSVVSVGATACAYCVSGENGVPLYVATHPSANLRDLWPVAKHFN